MYVEASLPLVAGGRTGWGVFRYMDAPSLTLPRRPGEGIRSRINFPASPQLECALWIYRSDVPIPT